MVNIDALAPEQMSALEVQFYTAALNGDREEAQRLEPLVNQAAAEREDRLNHNGSFLQAALWYAAQGIHVFPCVPGSKRPATLHGFKDASLNPQTITEWWTRWNWANIGLATGINFDVIDVDNPPAEPGHPRTFPGYQSVSKMNQAGILPPIIGRVRTPRGMHLYIQATGDKNGASVLPGIDYRGDGGYVLAPPSRVVVQPGNGVKVPGKYRWHDPIHLDLLGKKA